MSQAPVGIAQSTWQDALWRFWLTQLEALTEDKQRPDWSKRKIAALELCKMIGLADLVRAIGADGQLRPPPPWPEVDCVPVGGGPGLILCEVRTLYNGRKHGVRVGLKRREDKNRTMQAFDHEQIGEALARGRFELKRRIAAL